jgi:hypothetical protein
MNCIVDFSILVMNAIGIMMGMEQNTFVSLVVLEEMVSVFPQLV